MAGEGDQERLGRRDGGSVAPSRSRVDLVELALFHRWVIPCAATAALTQLVLPVASMSLPTAPALFDSLSVMVALAAWPLSLIVAFRMAVGLGSGAGIALSAAALSLIPGANIVVLVLLRDAASRQLKRAGIHLASATYRADVVARMLRGEICRQCAYDLTGNQSGRCPECGAEILAEERVRP